MPMLSGNSLTEWPACGPTTTIWRRGTRNGGRATGAGWSEQRGKRTGTEFGRKAGRCLSFVGSARQILGKFPDVAFWILEVCCTHAPCATLRVSDELDALCDQLTVNLVHVVDKGNELGGRAGGTLRGDRV